MFRRASKIIGFPNSETKFTLLEKIFQRFCRDPKERLPFFHVLVMGFEDMKIWGGASF